MRQDLQMNSMTPDYQELASLHRAALTEVVSREKGTRLELSFEDGFQFSLGVETLRLNCRCAWCSKARMENEFPASFPGVSLRGIEPFGAYAFNLIFSDGHARGVFPFAYLRSLGAAEAALQTLQETKTP